MRSPLFSYEDNGTAHGDLVLRLDEFERRCDSYFLALDNDLLPDRKDPEKVRAVLRELLKGWRTAVLALTPGDSAFLPYEFDDQYSGWLHVTHLESDNVEILPVWSGLEGWAFSPSAYESALERIGATTPGLEVAGRAAVHALRSALFDRLVPRGGSLEARVMLPDRGSRRARTIGTSVRGPAIVRGSSLRVQGTRPGLLDAAPPAGPVVGDDLPDHRRERRSWHILVAPKRDGARRGVAVPSCDDPLGVRHNRSVIDEHVDVILGREQGADVPVQREVRLVRPLDRLDHFIVRRVDELPDLLAQGGLPSGQSVDVGVDPGIP